MAEHSQTSGPELAYVSNELGLPVGLPLPNWQPPAPPSHRPMVGKYCRLEPLDVGRHSADLFAADDLEPDGRSYTYLAYGPFRTLEDYRQWMRETCCTPDPMFFAIIDLVHDKAAGVASYLRITPASGSIEVGHIHYSLRLQRSLAATEAMYLMMKNAFELGYRRYEWKCDALNAASRAAALRLGLSFEGIFRQATVTKKRNRDTAWYAAIDSEWPALKGAFETWLDPANFDSCNNQQVRLSTLTRRIITCPH